MGVDLRERVQAVAVGERQVEQHEGNVLLRELLQAARKAVGVLEAELHRRGLFREHLPDEARIARVVLDEEDLVAGLLGLHLPGPGGSVTTDSQKRSMDWITTMNFSRSTGLVT